MVPSFLISPTRTWSGIREPCTGILFEISRHFLHLKGTLSYTLSCFDSQFACVPSQMSKKLKKWGVSLILELYPFDEPIRVNHIALIGEKLKKNFWTPSNTKRRVGIPKLALPRFLYIVVNVIYLPGST